MIKGVLRIFFFVLLTYIPLGVVAYNFPIQRTSQGIELHNDHVKIIISSDAILKSCIDVHSGKDIAQRCLRKIVNAKTWDGRTISADSVTLNGQIMSVYIENKRINLKIGAYDDYFTFEVESAPVSKFSLITFLDLKLNYDYTDPDTFVATGIAMTLQTDPVYYPSGEAKAVTGRCTERTGIKGAKLAVICCKKDDLRSILKQVYSAIPKGTVPVTDVGGPFALDNDINKDDCVIVFDGTPSMVKEQIGLYKKLGIKQVDFHKGPKTFIQGQFSFPIVGSPIEFKKQVSDSLKEARIISMLHTYAFYIGYNASEILSAPRWQQQLEFYETFTLAKELSATETRLELAGDHSAITNDETYWKYHTPFLLVDNEIIRYSLDKNGFATCIRGQCGTVAKRHRAGSMVRIIGGQFSCIAPQIGSELYYEIARRTAKVYNEGGFRGIYFDAYDGLYVQLKHVGLEDYLWYYGATFINEVIKNCKEPPLIEYSFLHPTVWAARGRGGAWDTPYRGYKNFIDDHIKANKSLMNFFYNTTLGWYNFYPVLKSEPENYSTKYMFSDDVDYLGSKAIAYDQTMVYNGLKESDLVEIPAMNRNLELFCQYNDLRKAGYFSEQVKSKIKTGQYEYKLEQLGNEWGFREAVYCRSKLRDIAKNKLEGENPFEKQQPFMRLENLYSSKCMDRIELMKFDDNKDFYLQKCDSFFPLSVNMSKNLGIRIKVKGNGAASQDALCIRLTSSVFSGFADYIVRLNFEGWRDVVLSDLDNAENPDLKFLNMEDHLYKVHRYPVDFTKVSSISVYKSGDCKDVRIRQIDAVPLVQNPLIDPEVHIGNAIVIFNTTLQSGEYIEYQPRARNALAYDRLGNKRLVEVVKKGEIWVPKGKFFSFVRGRAAVVNVPSSVVLTIGLSGKFISN